MPGLKRLGLMILVLFGPGLLIYFFAKTLSNKFIELPYLGKHSSVIDTEGKNDTVYYTLPNFQFKKLNGEIVNSQSTKDQFLIFTTIQNACPEPDSCGPYIFHFNELLYTKLKDNQDNYSNVRIYSILTDIDGKPVYNQSEKLKESMATLNVDSDIWEIITGDPRQVFGFDCNGTQFIDLPSTKSNYELGKYAFVNSLVLVDRLKHIRGYTGARRDSDIRNFFDLLKILKKVEFDENRKKK